VASNRSVRDDDRQRTLGPRYRSDRTAEFGQQRRTTNATVFPEATHDQTGISTTQTDAAAVPTSLLSVARHPVRQRSETNRSANSEQEAKPVETPFCYLSYLLTKPLERHRLDGW
jgi:hypothetical protein